MSAAEPSRKAVAVDEASLPRVAKEGGIWRIRSLAAARQVLRARGQTTQAGFTAEQIPQGHFRHHPILISDGPLHDEQRRKVGRFFAAEVVAERYLASMDACAARLLSRAQAAGRVQLDDLALHYAVEVTAGVVGLTHAPVPAMSARLVRFFRQPPLDRSRPDLGRTGRQWAQAAWNGLAPIVAFYVADVRPAIRARRRQPAGDVISHLIEQGYSNADILVECVTYGTAGMVTTREFIAMAGWHLLTNPALAQRYQVAGTEERLAILHELIRLEPVVGHLYRRTRADLTVRDGDQEWTIPSGELVDLCVRQANADPEAVGADSLSACPDRELPAGVNPTGLSFGDGSHRCPGQPLAMYETDVLLTRLLRLRPTLLSEPTITWDHLIEGYQLRGFEVAIPR